MKSYFIFKNFSSIDIEGIIVTKLPQKDKSEERIESIIIPGRSGKLHISENTFESDIKPVEFYYEGENIDFIKSWLSSSGDVIFSNMPDRYYKAYVINKIPFEKVIPISNNCIVNFECEPYGYLLEGKQAITLNSPNIILNRGFTESEPIIKIYGQGNITLKINNYNISLKNIQDYIIVDTPLKDAYKDTMLKNNDMIGDFPILSMGNNSIDWTGTVTKVEIIPNWRCL